MLDVENGTGGVEKSFDGDCMVEKEGRERRRKNGRMVCGDRELIPPHNKITMNDNKYFEFN
jgi:hypothetical protein